MYYIKIYLLYTYYTNMIYTYTWYKQAYSINIYTFLKNCLRLKLQLKLNPEEYFNTWHFLDAKFILFKL